MRLGPIQRELAAGDRIMERAFCASPVDRLTIGVPAMSGSNRCWSDVVTSGLQGWRRRRGHRLLRRQGRLDSFPRPPRPSQGQRRPRSSRARRRLAHGDERLSVPGRFAGTKEHAESAGPMTLALRRSGVETDGTGCGRVRDATSICGARLLQVEIVQVEIARGETMRKFAVTVVSLMCLFALAGPATAGGNNQFPSEIDLPPGFPEGDRRRTRVDVLRRVACRRFYL